MALVKERRLEARTVVVLGPLRNPSRGAVCRYLFGGGVQVNRGRMRDNGLNHLCLANRKLPLLSIRRATEGLVEIGIELRLVGMKKEEN